MIRKPLAVCQRVTRTVIIPAFFCRRKIILGRRYYLKIERGRSHASAFFHSRTITYIFGG